jgi:hypothetical protein
MTAVVSAMAEASTSDAAGASGTAVGTLETRYAKLRSRQSGQTYQRSI